jgi:hypothetical protein
MDCLGLQGAELMGKYGINVPRGAAAGSVQEVNDALKNMFPSEKEVMTPQLLHLLLFDPSLCSSYHLVIQNAVVHGSVIKTTFKRCLNVKTLIRG